MMKFILSGLALFMLTSASGVQAQNTNVVKSFGKVCAAKNGEVKIPVVLRNISVADIKNLALTIDVAGEKQQMVVTPDMIKSGDDGASFYVTAATPSQTGLSDVTVTVDAVNGVKTSTADNTTKGSLMTVSRNVDHKVVVEEYTAIWCPTCPTGIVGIERTKINYGDKVLVIAAHSQDPITCRDYNDLTSKHMTLPRATVDRDPGINEVNPYLGTQRGDNGAGYGLGYDIEEQMAIAPVAEVKVSGGIDGKLITVKSEVTFLYTGAADYGVGYVVTQDSLSNPNWKQKNSMPIYYRDHPIIEKEPLFERWFNGEVEVPGVVYDDVARMASAALNGENVIPDQVNEEETFTNEHVFNLDKYVKVKDTDHMNLCVLLIDRSTGKIVNSASVKLSECNAIGGVEAEGEKAVEVARYTADGRRISVAQKGINIVKYSDGTAKKVVIK